MRIFHLLSLLLLLYSCGEKSFVSNNGQGSIAEHAMVVAAREEASNIGLEILRKGGNGFDAMVGTELALAVAYPFAGNLRRGI